MSFLLRATLFLLLFVAVASADDRQKAFAAEQPPNVVLIFADDLGYGDLGCYGATKLRTNPQDLLRLAGMVGMLTTIPQMALSDDGNSIKKPNIVFIFADDMGIGDVSVYNNKSMVKTPHLDQLASEGIRFTDAHTSGSRCVPSRFGLMTGQHLYFRSKGNLVPSRSGVAFPRYLPLMLKQNGYDTAMIGKWHLGVKWKAPGNYTSLTGGPLSWGFDSWFGIPISANRPPFMFYDGRKAAGTFSDTPFNSHSLGSRGGLAAEGWTSEAILPTLKKKSVDFIRSRKGNKTPFFLYFALTAPHTPLAPEESFVSNETEKTHLYLPLVRQVDWTVGEVLKAIDEAGLSGNTIVIFTSDNGSPATAFDGSNLGRDHFKLGEHVAHSANGPFRGFKLQNWEGGHRVPFILRWPGMVKPGAVSDVPFMVSDTFATVAGILGVTLPDHAAIDSVNVLDVWTGKATKKDYQDRVFVHADHKQTGIAVRLGKWKLMSKNEGLYDLEDDPGEKNNLSKSHPDIVEQLRKALESEAKRRKRIP